jgi:hypothetical protein
LFEGSEIYRQAFIRRVVEGASHADCKLITAPPVVGAALMAMHVVDTGGVGIDNTRKQLLSIDFSKFIQK